MAVADFVCPWTADYNPKHKTCPVCHTVRKSAGNMVRHLMKEHGYDEVLILDSFLGQLAKTEHLDPDEFMVDAEFEAARPVPTDRFECKLCGVEASVTAAFRHFTSKHGFQAADVNEWAVVKDGNAMRNKAFTRRFDIFYEGYQTWFAAQHPDAHVVVAAGEVAADVPKPPEKRIRHTTAANIAAFFGGGGGGGRGSSSSNQPAAPPADLATAVLSKIDALMGPKQIEVLVPDVLPSKFVFDWEHPDSAKLRHDCPIPAEAQEADVFNFDGFVGYLKTNTNQNDAKTRTYTLQNVRRFFYLLDFTHGPDVTPQGVICGLYLQNTFGQLKDSPMLDSRYGWTRGIIRALAHYCKYLLTVCNRHRHVEARTTIQSFLDEQLQGYLKEGTTYRKYADNQKKLRDAARIAGFPEVRLIKEQVKIAMAKLYIIFNHVVNEGVQRVWIQQPRSLPPSRWYVRASVNACNVY